MGEGTRLKIPSEEEEEKFALRKECEISALSPFIERMAYKMVMK